MDIQVYNELYDGLKQFVELNKNACHKASVVKFAKSQQTYPYIVFEEIRNVEGTLSFGDIPDKTSNLGYNVKIYAKTIGKVDKMEVAREIAQVIDNFLTTLGLRQVSFNPDALVADGDLYGLIIMYNANFYNNRRKIIL